MSVTQSADTETGSPVTLDRSLWSSFVNARSTKAFRTAWLAVLVNRVPSATLGALLEVAGGTVTPVAVVPDPRRDLGNLKDLAERCVTTGRPATRRSGEGDLAHLAYPLRIGEDGPVGAVALLELKTTDDAAIQDGLRDMHWAAGWIASAMWQAHAADTEARLARASTALDILAVASEHAKPEAAAMAVVNETQTVLSCDQVSIGLVQARRTAPRIRLLALSYSAWFRKRSALAEGLETAMEECFDQNASVSFPPLPSLERAISVAHAEHVRTSRTAHMLTVPLSDEAGPIGAMTCERRGDVPFDEDTRLMAEAIGALVGPVLDLKRRNRRWFGGRLWDGTVHVLGVLLGPRRLSWKLLALAILALCIAAATVKSPFRVQADAVLRGDEQRAAVAPFAGFVAEAPLRAGDRVQAGDLLARLDDADLRLEALRWRSEVDRLIAQAREAQAAYDRPQIALLEAQIAQARAQQALADAELARTRVTAPIDGIVVSGDLSQQLGAPVQVGDVLFEIAPEGAYRIEAFVDERDLRYVTEGTTGRLALAGRPTDGIDFTVTRITPLSQVRDGANTFRVEAEPDQTGPGLRPGMEGVAKIDAGEALTSWIWTRRLVDWARETLWTWQP